jgi:hypothetical protein
VSLGVLIYKEFSSKSESNATDIKATRSNEIAVSDKSAPATDSKLSEKVAPKEKMPLPLSDPATKSKSAKVIAYYFHGNFRCSTCQTIETYSQEAIEQYFAKELNSRTLEFKPINVEEAENRHYVQDYQLFSKSLVISLVKQGKEVTWKNLADVWKHVRDKDRFFQYVKEEVEKFLKET